MGTTINLTDDTFKWLLFQVVEHPFILIFCFGSFLFLLALYKERVKVISEIKLLPMFRKRKIIEADILQHQLFKDLDFYVKEKIPQIYDPEFYNHCDPVKLEIARDLLTIKFQNSLDWLREFFTKTNFKDPYLNPRSLFIHRREKNLATQYYLYKKQGIPVLFIEKFLEVSKPASNYVIKSIDDLLSDKIPLDIYEKLYLVLGNLSSYYSSLLMYMKDVIICINGDLKGQVYKGKVVGGNNYKTYPVPDRSFIPLVERKLETLTLQMKASRTSVCVFHDMDQDDYFNGFFSKIYEFENFGITPAFSDFQFKPTSLLLEFLPTFKQHLGYNNLVSNINERLSTLLLRNGTVAFYTYPLFVENKLKGFLIVGYNSLERYQELSEEKAYEFMKSTGFLINHYIIYENGLNYANNQPKILANWEVPPNTILP